MTLLREETGESFAYAIAAPHNGKELTVFKFSAQDEDPICAARYTIALPSEVNSRNSKICSFLRVYGKPYIYDIG